MKPSVKSVFLLLVLIQGLHSIEEYQGRLWEVFPPATMLTGLVSDNLETGFLVINIGLFVFGMACWAFSVRTGHFTSSGLIGFWIILQIINGIGHTFWSINQGGYTSGMLTAPFLFIVAIYLLKIRLQFVKDYK